jgi:esterase/lipase
MLKKAIKISSHLFPSLMVNLAYKKLTNPQVHKLREHESAILEKADKQLFPFKGFEIQTYKWGNGAKKVMLIHGWEGQAGNFADVIEKLVANNYTVYAFDGPSHGFSSRGKTSLFEFTELVGVLIAKFGVEKLISHSFGGVATTYSLAQNPNLKISKYVLLTTPNKFSERISDLSERVGITQKVQNRLIKKVESEINIKVDDVAVSSFVKNVNVAQALILHDKADKVIDISQSRDVCENWEQCELEELEGTGHFRILRTESVLNRVIEFLE